MLDCTLFLSPQTVDVMCVNFDLLFNGLLNVRVNLKKSLLFAQRCLYAAEFNCDCHLCSMKSTVSQRINVFQS